MKVYSYSSLASFTLRLTLINVWKSGFEAANWLGCVLFQDSLLSCLSPLLSSYRSFCTWQNLTHLWRPSSNVSLSGKLFKIFIQPSHKISHTILYSLVFCSYLWNKAYLHLFTHHTVVQLVVCALSPTPDWAIRGQEPCCISVCIPGMMHSAWHTVYRQ